MIKKYFESLGLRNNDKKEDPKDQGGNKEDGFPEVHDCYMIYGGPSTQLTSRQCKREC